MIVCPPKTAPTRTRLTVGGNIIDYPGDCSAPTSDLTMAKMLINSVISTLDARFMVMDVKNVYLYLHTPMERKEYMLINLDLITPEIK